LLSLTTPTDTTEFNIDRAQLSQDRRRLTIPHPTLIVLCGPSGSGKSTFAQKNFPPTWVVSTDHFRGLVCDDQRNQESSKEAFDLVYDLIEARLKFGRTTVVDSTALTPKVRKKLLNIANKYDFGVLLLLFDVPEKLCRERDAARTDPGPVGAKVVNLQYNLYQQVVQNAHKEGFNQIIMLKSYETASVEIEIVPLSVEKPYEYGPFDLIGDVHGCLKELKELLGKLGYTETEGVYSHKARRRVIFLGDLVNRGPNSLGVLQLVDKMVEAGNALYVRGNHCNYILSYFKRINGKEYNRTREWVTALTPAEHLETAQLVQRLVGKAPPYLLLDDGKLAVTHAGLEQNMIGRLSTRIYNFCINGEYTPESVAKGHPVRRDWAATYRGKTMVVYGHTPTAKLDPEIRHNTANLDQGCVYGGRLTAMRYPELDFVQVKATTQYVKRDS
jgi:protein phosphatase